MLKHCQRYGTWLFYASTFVLLLIFSQIIYQYQIDAWRFVVVQENRTEKKISSLNRTSSEKLFFEHIENCPECFLSLLPNDDEKILGILNRISVQSKATFYPLTMNLFYNQPIRFYTIGSKNLSETIESKRRYWIERIENETSINRTSILNSLLNSLKKPFQSSNKTNSNLIKSNETKLILYYTKFFGNTYWYNDNEKSVYQNDLNPENCPISVNACRVTIDHRLFPQSNAALIHLRESINYEQLNSLKREENQRFVFFLKESPVHSPTFTEKQHGSLFNYTQTYRPDSDLSATTLRDLFFFFDRPIHFDIDYPSILRTKQSDKVAVAVISNCGDSSSRLKYIAELKKYLPVDIFGRCGMSCPKSVDCRQYAFSTYKFYLSFENSLCDEYVTEKFFYALNSARIIPVVLGWAKYDSYVPSSAYIDIRDYSSPQALAMHLHYLHGNSSAYLEYFRWRDYALRIKLPKYICELCLKLFFDDSNRSRQRLTRIDRYWNRHDQCHSLIKDKNGTWRMT